MGELPADARLGAIRLRVGDVDRIGRFYEESIGLQVLGRDGGVTALGVTDGHRSSSSRPIGTRRAGRRTRRGSSISRSSSPPAPTSRTRFAAWSRRGWRLSGASDHLVSEALYLSDPEGNGIELYRDRPRDEWPVAGGDLQMDTLPLDLGSLLSEADGADGEAACRSGRHSGTSTFRSPTSTPPSASGPTASASTSPSAATRARCSSRRAATTTTSG